jgi:multidrug efflux pump subunit AcrA (membrane-fusion protein)
MPSQIAQGVSYLRPEGVYLAELIERFGLSQPRVSRIMLTAEREGRAFSIRVRNSTVYYPTRADMEAGKRARDAATAARERLRWRGRYDKMKSSEKAQAARLARAQAQALKAAEAELAKQRARLDREAKAAQKAREKAEAKSQQARLKAETKALSLIAKRKGTKSPEPPKPRGPAHMDGELDFSKLKGQEIRPPMRDRFAPDPGFVGAFSSLKPGQYLEAA